MAINNLLPFLLLTSGSELLAGNGATALPIRRQRIEFNPTSNQDVLTLLDYLAHNTGRRDAVASVSKGGIICWRHNRDITPVGSRDWKQAEWLAAQYSRPGYEIKVVPMYFRCGTDTLSSDRIW